MKLRRKNLLFANKTFLDNLTLRSEIIGRESKVKELIHFFLGYKIGLVVPFVSVYGRSGSGKSTIVKFVCETSRRIYLTHLLTSERLRLFLDVQI
jgi:cell division control protein 6